MQNSWRGILIQSLNLVVTVQSFSKMASANNMLLNHSSRMLRLKKITIFLNKFRVGTLEVMRYIDGKIKKILRFLNTNFHYKWSDHWSKIRKHSKNKLEFGVYFSHKSTVYWPFNSGSGNEVIISTLLLSQSNMYRMMSVWN